MKIRFVSAITLAMAAGGALFACSNSDSGGTSGACQAYASALVGVQERCAGTIDPNHVSDYTARYAKLCADALALPGVTDISAQLQTCAANLDNAACNESVNQVDGCDVEISGTFDDGAACAIGAECKSGECTISAQGQGGDDAGAAACGTCAPAIADGADCTMGGVCVSGDVCNFITQDDGGFSAVCAKKQAPGDVGAKCQSTDDCKAPNHCELVDGAAGSCAAPLAAGATCQQSSECDANLVCTGQTTRTCGQPVAVGGACGGNDCAAGLACDFSTAKCVKIQFAAAGAACDGNTIRCSQGDCKQAETDGGAGGGAGGSGAGTATCPTIIQDGQPCDDNSTSSECDDFASCYAGTCVLVPPACK